MAFVLQFEHVGFAGSLPAGNDRNAPSRASTAKWWNMRALRQAVQGAESLPFVL